QFRLLFLSAITTRAPRVPLCPYTTLFRSRWDELRPGRPTLRHIPQPEATVVPDRCELLAVGAEGDIVHRTDRTAEEAQNPAGPRSEEHTSELQSRGHLVCRLLLEKKNTHIHCACGHSRMLPGRSQSPIAPSAPPPSSLNCRTSAFVWLTSANIRTCTALATNLPNS